MEFHQQHFSPMDQFLNDPDTGDILGVKANKAGALDFLPASERDFPRPNGRVFYVDFRTAANGGKGSNANSGRSWRAPYATMAKALSACVDYDTIVFIGKCQEYGLALPSGVEYVTIQGGGSHPMCNALWKPNGTTYGILVSTKGIRFRNFKAEPETGYPLIKAQQTAASGINGSDGVIENVECNGNGMLLDAFSVDQWTIRNCHLHDMETAIRCNDTGHSQALRWLIVGNRLINNDNHVVAKLTDSVVVGNLFWAVGNSKTTTSKLDLRNGLGRNLITKNVLRGTYSIAGGYAGNSTDDWYDNDTTSGKSSTAPA